MIPLLVIGAAPDQGNRLKGSSLRAPLGAKSRIRVPPCDRGPPSWTGRKNHNGPPLYKGPPSWTGRKNHNGPPYSLRATPFLDPALPRSPEFTRPLLTDRRALFFPLDKINPGPPLKFESLPKSRIKSPLF